MDLHPIWAVFQAWSNWVSSQWIYSHFEQYFMPGRIWPGMKYCSNWAEIHGFTPNLSSISGLVKLGIIPMNLLPFWAVFHSRLNSTGHEILLKLGWNSWIYTQFEQYFRPGQIGYHPNEFTPILSSISCPVKFEIQPVEFDGAWNTAQIGLKFMDLHPIWAVFQAWSNWVSSQWIYSHFEQYFMPGQIWNLTGWIRPGMKYCSNWVEIHGFTPWSNWVSSQWIYSHFEQYFMPGRNRPVELGVNPLNFNPIWAVFHGRSNSTGHEILVKMGVNSLRLHLYSA